MHLRGRPSGPVVSLSWPSSTAILLSTLPPFLIPSPLPPLPLSPLSLLSRASIILWPVAFRNLFVIKAAIYFTLIEEIGRLPLAATIYHVPTPLSLSFSPPLSHFIASQEDYTLLKMYSRISMYNCANPCTGFLRVYIYMFHLHRLRIYRMYSKVHETLSRYKV